MPEPAPQSVKLGLDYDEAKDLMVKRRWAEAAIALKKIVGTEPGNEAAWEDLARALTFSGRREEALAVLSQAANRAHGKRADSLARRVQVISKLFLTQQSAQAYQDGLGLLRAQKPKAARERLEKVLIAEPDNVEVLLRVGQALVLESDPDSAAEKLRLARRLNPHSSDVSLWLGRALHQRGELSAALSELQVAASALPDSELAQTWFAEALSSAGDRAEAVSVLEGHLKSHPLHLRALLALVRVQLQSSPREAAAYWGMRKHLQLVASRKESYFSEPGRKVEGELGLDLRGTLDLAAETAALLQRVEAQLEAIRAREVEREASDR